MPRKKLPPHPMQPIYLDKEGVARFRSNAIVRYLLDAGGLDLNRLVITLGGVSPTEDWDQFFQLIGYSVSGYGDLSGVSKQSVKKADAEAEKL